MPRAALYFALHFALLFEQITYCFLVFYAKMVLFFRTAFRTALNIINILKKKEIE